MITGTKIRLLSRLPRNGFLQSGPAGIMREALLNWLSLLQPPHESSVTPLDEIKLEQIRVRSTDRIHVLGLSVAYLEVIMCARTYTCLCVWSVCNHSIKSTAITNRISWVDSRSLSLLIDFLRFPSVHQGRTFWEGPQWESLPWDQVNVLWQTGPIGAHRSVSGKVKWVKAIRGNRRRCCASLREKCSLVPSRANSSGINLINESVRMWRGECKSPWTLFCSQCSRRIKHYIIACWSQLCPKILRITCWKI